MSRARLLALRFELAHYLKQLGRDPKADIQRMAHVARQIAAIDAQLKAAPPLAWRKAA